VIDRRSRIVAVVVLAVLSLLVGAPRGVAADEVAFSWADPRLPAAAGLARDTTHGVYWAVNAGAGPSTAVFALRPDGRTAARVVLNLPTVAVEAIAWEGGKVYVADIGDPQRVRKSVSISVATIATVADQTVTYRTYQFAYPDGAHDAEAILVASDGQITIVTSGASPGVYRAPATLVTSKPNQLARVADAPAGITDAGYLPSGRLVMRTATTLLEVDPVTWQAVATSELPAQDRGKSVTVTLDGASVLAAGQGLGNPVHRLALPSATPSPTPEPVETPTPSATPVPDDGGQESDSSGTMVALVGAGILALVAGAYTLVRR
jgi:hypothetical protein